MSRRTLVVGLVLAFVASSCASTGITHASGPFQLVAYKYATGKQTFQFDMAMGGKVKFSPQLAQLAGGSAAGGGTDIKMQMSMLESYEVAPSGANFVISIGVTNVKGTVDLAGINQKLDTSKLGLMGTKLQFTVDAKGNLLDVQGGADLGKALGSALGGSFGGGLPGADPTSANSCPALPDHTVKPGDSWDATSNFDLNGKKKDALFGGSFPKAHNTFEGERTSAGVDALIVQSRLQGPVDLQMNTALQAAGAGLAGAAGGPAAAALGDLGAVGLVGSVDLTSQCALGVADDKMLESTSSGRMQLTYHVSGSGMMAQVLDGLGFDLHIDLKVHKA